MTDIQHMKQALFEAYLAQDACHEWSFEALELAAEQVGLDAALPRILFKGDLDEALLEFNAFSDEQIFKSFELEALGKLRTHEKVQQALEKKIRFFAEHAHKTVAIFTYLASPLRVKYMLQLQASTVNQIWYFAGDQATDFNYYTKRALLGYIYKVTFLYWLKSRRAPVEKTLTFMTKRFKEVAMIPHFKEMAKGIISKLNPFRRAC